MQDFIIPKNKDFSFSIKVIEHDSFIAQDLTNMDTATFKVFQSGDETCIFSQTLNVPANYEVSAEVPAVNTQNEINGMLEATILAIDTDKLNVTRGPVEDNYYLKSVYSAVIEVTFTDDTLPINVLLDKIYVSPTGATCV